MDSPFHVVLTDHEFSDVEIERGVVTGAGGTFEAHRCETPDQLVSAALEADAVLTQYVPLSRATLERLPKLRAVARYGVGYDQIDVAAATELGVAVCNVPDYGVDEVATHAFSLILYFMRGLDMLPRGVAGRRWGAEALERPIRPLSGAVLGVVGVGRIGMRLVEFARGLGMDVIAADPYVRTTAVALVEFEKLLERSDVVSIHCPLNDETRGLFDAGAFERMKPSAFLINVSRGGIVESAALNEALRSGSIAGAGLDVLVGDPPDWGDPLLSAPNVIVTGHNAWYSTHSIDRLRTLTAGAVVALFQGDQPTGLLNPQVLTSVKWADWI